MREELKARLSGAGGALLTSAAIAAFRAGQFGSGNFSLQVLVAIIGVSWAPFFYFTEPHLVLSAFVYVPLFLAWFTAAFVPAFYALLTNLFTGHRFPGSQWFDAVWRIYAILALWIGFAVLNERIIRPWWRKTSAKYLGGMRSSSVSAQAQQITLDKRAQALEAIKARVVVVLRKKKLAEKTVEDKKDETEKAKESIKRAEGMLEKANERLASCEETEKELAKENVELMNDLLRNARSHEKGIHAEIARCELELEEIAGKLEQLQHEWTEALHIQNYTAFYR